MFKWFTKAHEEYNFPVLNKKGEKGTFGEDEYGHFFGSVVV